MTFRDSLISTEKVVKGEWKGTVKDVNAAVPISLEDGYAERNSIKIGDTLTFNVQGTLLTTVLLAIIRDVDLGGVQTNFLVLFPKGAWKTRLSFTYCSRTFSTTNLPHGFSRLWYNSFLMFR